MNSIVQISKSNAQIANDFEAATTTVIRPGQPPGFTNVGVVEEDIKDDICPEALLIPGFNKCVKIELIVTTSPGDVEYTANVPLLINKAVRTYKIYK